MKTINAVIECQIEQKKLNLDASTRKNLIRIIRECGDEQNHCTNIKANMTNWAIQNQHQEFKELTLIAEALAYDISPAPNLKLTSRDCWGALYKQGEETVEHVHWGSLWSWCYYLKIPDGASPLRLHNIDNKPMDIYPEEDDFLIFNSWIKHSVPPLEVDDERIVVAGNVMHDINLTNHYDLDAMVSMGEMFKNMMRKYHA